MEQASLRPLLLVLLLATASSLQSANALQKQQRVVAGTKVLQQRKGAEAQEQQRHQQQQQQQQQASGFLSSDSEKRELQRLEKENAELRTELSVEKNERSRQHAKASLGGSAPDQLRKGLHAGLNVHLAGGPHTWALVQALKRQHSGSHSPVGVATGTTQGNHNVMGETISTIISLILLCVATYICYKWNNELKEAGKIPVFRVKSCLCCCCCTIFAICLPIDEEEMHEHK